MRTTAVRVAHTSVPFAENVCMRTSAKSDVLPSTEFGYPSGDGTQIRLLGAAP